MHDVDLLPRRLPNLIGKYLVLDPKLNHMETTRVRMWSEGSVV